MKKASGRAQLPATHFQCKTVVEKPVMRSRKYHTRDVLVHAGRWRFTVGEVWSAIDHAERDGFTLDEIGLTLDINRSAAVCALVLRRHVVLRALIDEARP